MDYSEFLERVSPRVYVAKLYGFVNCDTGCCMVSEPAYCIWKVLGAMVK